MLESFAIGARSNKVTRVVRYCYGFSGGGASLIFVLPRTTKLHSEHRLLQLPLGNQMVNNNKEQSASPLKQGMNDQLLTKCEAVASRMHDTGACPCRLKESRNWPRQKMSIKNRDNHNCREAHRHHPTPINSIQHQPTPISTNQHQSTFASSRIKFQDGRKCFCRA